MNPKLLYSFALFCLVLTACSGLNKAKKTQISEAKVDFQMSYMDMPEEMKAFESMLPKESYIAFKDSAYRMEQVIPMGGKQITMRPEGSKSTVILLEVMGRKVVLEQPETDEPQAKAEIEYIKEEKTIAGYTCKKAIVQMPDQDVPVTVWYCPEIRNWSEEQWNVPGMPLEFDLLQVGMKIRLTATAVSLDVLADELFVVPDDYEAMTEEELNRLIPGM